MRAAISQARDLDALAAAARGIAQLPRRLLDAGIAPAAITAQLTSLNDLVVDRLLDLTRAAPLLAEVGGCWLALGSQGRGEQTPATDQDNAILFDDADDPERRRRALLPIARQVNVALDRCGFALCRGDVMASNPSWCLSHSEWRMRFSSWIDRPEPQALLNAAIFFDFRAVGPPNGAPNPLVDRLRGWLAAYAQGNERFLLLMVFNALRNQPPLGLLRDFVLARGGEHPHTLNLKINGVQPFVEAARVLALASRVESPGTVARLIEAARARSIPEQESAGWCEAFQVIQGLRLRLNAGQLARGADLHNDLDPRTLSPADRRSLKDALRQARNLQNRLASAFSLAGSGRL